MGISWTLGRDDRHVDFLLAKLVPPLFQARNRIASLLNVRFRALFLFPQNLNLNLQWGLYPHFPVISVGHSIEKDFFQPVIPGKP